MITVTDLHKRFGPTEVLRGVSLQVGRGEVAVILGASGCGKSTFLRTINGLDSFDQGRIQVADIVLEGAAGPGRDAALRQIRRRVGMVFQQFHLFPHRTVIENVMEAPVYVLGKARDEARQQARELLERVDLADKTDVYPGHLSGGQQQRVAIARALALCPEAILFDEPTSALDPQMTAEVVRVMTDLARSGQTMVVVTHGMNFARTIAHTVHVMDAGRIAESGTPQQVFESPREEATRRFLAAEEP